MYAVLALVLAGAVTSNSPAASPPRASEMPQPYEGTIVLVHRNEIHLVVDQKAETFILPDRAMIFVNGAEASLADLKSGYRATIMASRKGQRLLARSIDAKIQPCAVNGGGAVNLRGGV